MSERAIALLHDIDPSLTYVQTFHPSSICVLQVRRDNELYVLKVAPERACFEEDFDIFGNRHIIAEQRALQYTADVMWTPTLVDMYPAQDTHEIAILKTYVEGKSLFLETEDHKLHDSTLEKQLGRAIATLHKRGVARLDINGYNVIISPDRRSLNICDLGYATFADEVDKETFVELQEQDWKAFGWLTVTKREDLWQKVSSFSNTL